MLALGIDRTDGGFALALLDASGRTCRLLAAWTVFDAADRHQSLAETIARHCPRPPDAIATALDGKGVTHRILRLPFSDPGRLAATVPFELESLVPFDLADTTLAFTIIGRGDGGTEVLAALAPREELERHLEEMRLAGIDPAVVDVAPTALAGFLAQSGQDALLIEAREGGAVTLLRARRIAGLHLLDGKSESELLAEARWRALALANGAALPPLVDAASAPSLVGKLGAELRVESRALESFLPAWAAGADPTQLRAIALAARAAGLVSPGLNFRTGEFRYHAPSEEAERQLRATGIVAAAVLLVGLVSYGAVQIERRAELQDLRAEIRRATTGIVTKATPGTERVRLEGAVQALERRRQMLGGAESARPRVLELLRRVNQAVPATLPLEVDDFGIDADGIRLHARTDSYESVDILKRSLAGIEGFSKADVRDVKAGIDGRIEFRASLDLPEEPAK